MKTGIKDLGGVGLVTDRDAHDLPANAWSSLSNIRCKRGRIEPMDGYEDMTSIINTGSQPVYEHQLVPLSNATSFYWLYPYDSDGDGYAEDINVIDQAGTITPITRNTGTDTYTDSDQWSVCTLGGVVILNNGIDNPQYWGGNTGTDCLPLPYDDGVATPATTYVWNAINAEVNANTDDSTGDISNGTGNTYKAKVIRAFKNQLIALNITEGSGNYPHMIHWSHPAEPGTVPVTWDYQNDAYDAGRVNLGETSGWVLDAIPLGDILIVYKEDAIYRLSYVGGEFIYDRDTVTTSHGLYTTNCAVDFGNTHFCVGDGVVYIHSGGEIKNILEGKSADNLFNAIDETYYYRTFVVHNKPENEIWICYPETDNQWANKALIWNYSTGAWYPRDIPQSSSIKIGQSLTGTGISVWDNVSDVGDLDGAGYTTWAAWDSDQWVTRDYSAIGDTLIAASDQLIKFNVGQTSNTVTATRTNILPDEIDSWYMFKEVIPHASGESFSVQIGTQTVLDGSVTWESSQTFTPGTSRKLDFRCSGPIFAIRFSGNNNWRISEYTIDVVPRGTR